MNFTTTGASTNSTTPSIWIVDSGQMYIFYISVLFGLPVQFYIIWLIITGTGHGVRSGFLNLNLSCCEICVSVDFLFFILSNFMSSLFPLALVLQGLAITGRFLFQCLMCVERYLAVVHPVTFLKYKPLRYRVICCTVAWIITLGSCLVCLIIFLLSTITVHTWFLLMQLLLFFCIQLFCLLAVLRALKQSGPGERGREREREEENHMKRRAFYIILITTVTMVISYVPVSISAFFTILRKQNIVSLWNTALICNVLASFVQPVLYLHQTGKISCLCSP